MNYTKGPWFYNDFLIEYRGKYGYQQGLPTTEDNMRLMALAPELVDALYALYNVVNELDLEFNTQKDVLQNLDKAMSEAYKLIQEVKD